MDDSRTSISDLAYSCGYTSLRTFNRNFVDVKKMTPETLFSLSDVIFIYDFGTPEFKQTTFQTPE